MLNLILWNQIKKNTLLFLLFLVILATAVNVIAAVYYHASYGGIEKDFNEQTQSLQSCKSSLADKAFRLDDATQRLTTQQSREQEFAEQFIDEKETKESLSKQAQTLRIEKEMLASRLQVIEEELADAEQKTDQKTETIVQLTKDNRKLKADLEDCEEE